MLLRYCSGLCILDDYSSNEGKRNKVFLYANFRKLQLFPRIYIRCSLHFIELNINFIKIYINIIFNGYVANITF
jgi:hypothetical protein